MESNGILRANLETLILFHVQKVGVLIDRFNMLEFKLGDAKIFAEKLGLKVFTSRHIQRAARFEIKGKTHLVYNDRDIPRPSQTIFLMHEVFHEYLGHINPTPVEEEIVSCLAGVAVAPCNCHKKSRNYLRKIIHKQYIDPQILTIDGLNELTENQRKTISQFRSDLFSKNFATCKSYHKCPPHYCLKCAFGKAFFKI